MGKAGAVNARLLYFLYRNKLKDFNYEKITLAFYGDMLGCDACVAIMR